MFLESLRLKSKHESPCAELSASQVIPGSCPSFSQLVELAEAFAQLKFQEMEESARANHHDQT